MRHPAQLLRILFAAFLFVATIPLAQCIAQSERYELGKRLRRFELAWQAAPEDLRAASAKPMQQAVQSFFSLQFSNAARQLDQAYFVVRRATPATAFEQLSIAQRLEFQPVTLSEPATALSIRLRPFYKEELIPKTGDEADSVAAAAALDKNKVTVKLINGERAARVSAQFSWSEMTTGASLSLVDVPEGDYWIETTLASSTETLLLPQSQLSLVHDFENRVQALESWLKEQSSSTQRAEQSDPTETVRLTVRQVAQTLRSQLDQRPLETDYPTHRLMKLAEQLMASPAQATTLFNQEAQDSIWLTLSHARKSLPVRVQLPHANASSTSQAIDSAKPSKPPKPLPVLIAFHGAGGSENMFFETYGAGRLIELATQRGWMVVTPRHPLLGMPLSYREMLESLSHFYSIDTEHVYLVGHSMGAAEVVRQVALEATPPQAAVILGGGGSAKDSPSIKQTQWFIAAGELDFGRGGAKSLASRLKQLGCRSEYRDYPNVEHMVIVQAALDDVFTFLDKTISR